MIHVMSERNFVISIHYNVYYDIYFIKMIN
jgi:hypothetical protein